MRVQVHCPQATVLVAQIVPCAWLGGCPLTRCTHTHTQPRCCSSGQPQCSCARSTCGAWAAAAAAAGLLGQAAAACGPPTPPGVLAVACVQMPSRSQASCSTQHPAAAARCGTWLQQSGLPSPWLLTALLTITFVCAHRARCLHLRGCSYALPQAAANPAQGATQHLPAPCSIAAPLYLQPPTQYSSAHGQSETVHAYCFLGRKAVCCPCAATQVLLVLLLQVLEAQGHSVLSPSDRTGLHPLVVPISTFNDTGVIGVAGQIPQHQRRR